MGNKRNKRKPSKPRFRGNQHTEATVRENASANSKLPGDQDRPIALSTPTSLSEATTSGNRETPVCRSYKKIKRHDKSDYKETCDSFFFFMNMQVLKSLVQKIGSCPDCQSAALELHHMPSYKMGLSLNFSLTCKCCEWSYSFYSSPKLEKCTPGLDRHIINLQTVLAFREIGRGYEAIKTFSACMGMPQPMTPSVYSSINDTVGLAYEAVAQQSMKEAADELRTTEMTADEEILDTQVTIDGTWQKRGHSSLNGVVVACSKNAKVIDCQVMSKHCKSCQIWSRRQGTPEYDNWQQNHNCSINHRKSAGAMEGDGAVAIFSRSIELHKMRYLHYIGDGDTCSFLQVCESKPYGELIPEKLECVGHIQKRLGTRLRKLRNDLKGKKLEDGKMISGRGRLTDKAINVLQNYFGMAIRQNTANVGVMKRAIGAVLYHCSDIDDTTRHQFCPKNESGWCKWQQDKINGTCKHRNNLNLPSCIKRLLEPIFRDLSKDELLEKCLHGQTQNANEAFNSILWKKCPKEIFVGRSTLELATYSAIITYNDGFERLSDVLSKLGLEVSMYFFDGAAKKNNQRIASCMKRSSEKGKKRRKILRATRKGFTDKEKEEEGGESYITGGF